MDATGQKAYTLCNPGTYGPGNNTCLQCADGYITDYAGATSTLLGCERVHLPKGVVHCWLSLLALGVLEMDVQRSVAVPRPVWRVHPFVCCCVRLATACMSCPAGKYEVNHTACVNCSAGAYTNVAASTQCSLCSPGRYQSAVGATGCISCVAGLYQDGYGSALCKKYVRQLVDRTSPINTFFVTMVVHSQCVHSHNLLLWCCMWQCCLVTL